MTEQELYKSAVSILENFYDESEVSLKEVTTPQTWREKTALRLFKQSRSLIFTLLSNSEQSKYLNSNYTSDLILFGTLGRLIRDIYVNVAYLSTDKFSEEQMKLCWDYQTTKQKLNLIQFERDQKFLSVRQQLTQTKSELEGQLSVISFATKGSVLNGKDEKLLSLDDIAKIKNFHTEKFRNEFVFFSQFAHSTAFANSLTSDNGIYLGLLGVIYDKIATYFVGVVTESLTILAPGHSQLLDLQNHFARRIADRWNVESHCT